MEELKAQMLVVQGERDALLGQLESAKRTESQQQDAHLTSIRAAIGELKSNFKVGGAAPAAAAGR
jgi:hypothetical protein